MPRAKKMSKAKNKIVSFDDTPSDQVPEFEMKDIYALTGKGYEDFWWFAGRYCVLKGSRNSKKSFTTAYWIIYNMMEHPKANTLVVRKVEKTNRDSTYALLCKVIYLMGVDHLWKMTKSPLELEYKAGNKIIFRGLDDPYKLSSVTVTRGVLCWMWVEEAYQIDKEEDFDRIDESIRGIMPDGLEPRIMLTFNPWHKEHWLKKRFFDKPDPDVLAKTTNYLCNEFISEADRRFFERMKENNPRMYQVAGLGDWGASEGLIFENWEVVEFDVGALKKKESVVALFGLDFGYATDPTALICCLLDHETRSIYVYDEWYAKGMTNMDIAERLKEYGYAKERIVYDSAEPKSGAELRKFGISRATPALKGQDSILYGIQKLQQYYIFIHPKCADFTTEIGLYCWDQDTAGKILAKPIDDFNHGIDALRYAVMEMLYRTGKRGKFVSGPSEDTSSEAYRRFEEEERQHQMEAEDKRAEERKANKYVFSV